MAFTVVYDIPPAELGCLRDLADRHTLATATKYGAQAIVTNLTDPRC